MWHLHTGTLGAQRPSGRCVVAILDNAIDAGAPGVQHSPHTLVAVITDDMPFLLDSLLLAFGSLGIGVHLIIHPVLDLRRDRSGHLVAAEKSGTARRESWQLFEVDRQLGAARLQLIKTTLTATLEDVRVAVADWQPMLQQAQAAAADLQDPGVPPEADAEEAQALIEWMVAGQFTFLGYRRYRLRRGARRDLLLPVPQSGLGILRPGRPGDRQLPLRPH